MTSQPSPRADNVATELERDSHDFIGTHTRLRSTAKTATSGTHAPDSTHMASTMSRAARSRGAIRDLSQTIADMQLDDSVADTTSLWLEMEDEKETQQLRIDSPNDTQASPAEAAISDTTQDDAASLTAKMQSDTSPVCDFDVSPLGAWDAGPIDVMIVSGHARVPMPSESESEEDATVDEPAPHLEETASPETLVEPSVPRALTEASITSETSDEPDSKPNPDTEQLRETVRRALPSLVPAWEVELFQLSETIERLFFETDVMGPLANRLGEAVARGLSTIAVTSSRAGEGRSTLAIGMALSIASAGKRVALVDADHEHVGLADQLGLDIENGWDFFFDEAMPLPEAAVYSSGDNVTLFPISNEADATTVDVIRLESLLSQLVDEYDVIVVDLPADQSALASLCDTAMIVRDVTNTTETEVETYASQLRRKGCTGVGIVENFCTRPAA
ncbi:MAG: division plane positioning ATPase MipZ [Planctomycetota bacterium]